MKTQATTSLTPLEVEMLRAAECCGRVVLSTRVRNGKAVGLRLVKKGFLEYRDTVAGVSEYRMTDAGLDAFYAHTAP